MQANLENALQAVNAKISLSESEVKRNNEILAKVVDSFISEMKKDSLFKELYQRVFYGGSFYDGLRVGEPSEFDLDILLRIPKRMTPAIDITNVPGFVNCKIPNRPSVTNETFLKMITEDGFIKTTSVRAWMEGITDKALKSLCPGGELNVLSYKLQVTASKTGPAMTIHLRGNAFSIDIDFIPCFVFGANDWPKGGYRQNSVHDKPEFFIVPKTPKREDLPYRKELLWRLSFQEQERKMMDGKQFLKPTLRLLKRLRDHQGQHAVASYYIKTMFLWELQDNDTVFNKSLAAAFIHMLDKYIGWLRKKEIPYFWNKRNNLLVGANPVTLENFVNRLEKIRLNLSSSTINTVMGV